jgi:hypothetical protein
MTWRLKTWVIYLYTIYRGYFELSFVMIELGNLDVKLGVTLCIFHNGRGMGNFFI